LHTIVQKWNGRLFIGYNLPAAFQGNCVPILLRRAGA